MVVIIIVQLESDNNSFFGNYDPEIFCTYIMYFDATNVHRYSMSKCLPLGEFQWLSQTEFDSTDIFSIDENADYGYVFEEYPE